MLRWVWPCTALLRSPLLVVSPLLSDCPVKGSVWFRVYWPLSPPLLTSPYRQRTPLALLTP